MDITKGQLFYYGGILGIAIIVVAFVIMMFTFQKNKAKLLKKIEDEF